MARMSLPVTAHILKLDLVTRYFLFHIDFCVILALDHNVDAAAKNSVSVQ